MLTKARQRCSRDHIDTVSGKLNMAGDLYQSASQERYDHTFRHEKRTITMYSSSMRESVSQIMVDYATKSRADADGFIAMVKNMEAELVHLTETLSEREKKVQYLTEKLEKTEGIIGDREHYIVGLERETEDRKKEVCLHFVTPPGYYSLTKTDREVGREAEFAGKDPSRLQRSIVRNGKCGREAPK